MASFFDFYVKGKKEYCLCFVYPFLIAKMCAFKMKQRNARSTMKYVIPENLIRFRKKNFFCIFVSLFILSLILPSLKLLAYHLVCWPLWHKRLTWLMIRQAYIFPFFVFIAYLLAIFEQFELNGESICLMCTISSSNNRGETGFCCRTACSQKKKFYKQSHQS